VGEIVVTVNNRPYTLACGEGEEPRLRRLAESIDAKIASFAADLGQVGEARLLLLAALVIADEAAEARERLAALEERAGADAAALERAASGLDGLAGRIEALAAALETS
jgi:cell division protein ZapA